MSSIGGTSQNPKPWPPYGGCSQGICSIYCPQWCYVIFPPPPPFYHESISTNISPIVIAVIGVLATVFIMICYFLLISKYRRRRGDGRITTELNENRDEIDTEAWRQAGSVGLDEAVIRQISVCKYKKSDGLIEGTECSVCLNEFEEEESLRLLPKCCHAFHLNCIDTWLKSHSSCPLCRANIITQNDFLLSNQIPAHVQAGSRVVNAAALEYQPTDAQVFVMERSVREETVLAVGEDGSETGVHVPGESEIGHDPLVEAIESSASLVGCASSVADHVLQISEDDRDLHLQPSAGV